MYQIKSLSRARSLSLTTEANVHALQVKKNQTNLEGFGRTIELFVNMYISCF